MYRVSRTSLRVLLCTAPVQFPREKIAIQLKFEFCGSWLYRTEACMCCYEMIKCNLNAENNNKASVESIGGKTLSLCFCDIAAALSNCKREKTFEYSCEIFLIRLREIFQPLLSALQQKLTEFCKKMSDKLKERISPTVDKPLFTSCKEDRVIGKCSLCTANKSHDAVAHIDDIALSTDTPLGNISKQLTDTSIVSRRCPERDIACVSKNTEYVLSSRPKEFSRVKATSVRWIFDVRSWSPSEDEWISALSAVQPEECTRICRFAFRRDARASLAGRLLARLFVSRALSIPWGAVRLVRDARGKPTVKEGLTDAKVNFSVSHAGTWAVLAGEAGYGSSVADAVGVDTVEEKHRDAAHLLRIMKRNLSTVEQVAIENAGRDGPAVFFRLWALKECYLKATGEGIGGGPELCELSFSFCCNRLPNVPGCVETGTSLEVKGRPVPCGWHFEESRIDTSHIVAVAISGSEGNACNMKMSPPVFEEVSWNEIQAALEPVTHYEPSFYLDYFKKPESPASLQNISK